VLGEICQVISSTHNVARWAEVVALDGLTVSLMTLGEMTHIEIGDVVVASGETLTVPVSDRLLGRVLDCMGRPIDSRGDVGAPDWRSVFATPPPVMQREPIRERMTTGVRSIDGLLTIGRGQRVGIFSGSGVGKSTLLGMIARNTSADVNVVALVGERGREVREFIESDLGEEGLRRSVVVASTSNEPPLARLRAAFVATTVAEHFRDQGLDVMLLFDSVTRVARAQREIGLAVGEPPANRGYTPSVFALLPKLMERSGASASGSITAFYTILVEGDDMDEPIADNVRGVLDGHIVLSRALAERAHYPAIDILQSISRLAPKVAPPATTAAAVRIKRLLATYASAEDLIDVGAYVPGTNPEIDASIERRPHINAFLQQSVDDPATVEESDLGLLQAAGHAPTAPEADTPNRTDGTVATDAVAAVMATRGVEATTPAAVAGTEAQ
jgi:flagellum-specific ATP synthase